MDVTIEALIFDMDGVLIDTEQVWDEVRKNLTQELNGKWSEEAQHKMMGMNSFEWSTYMTEDLEVPMKPDEISNEVVKRIQNEYTQELPTNPHAVETVRRLSKQLPLAIASSSNRPIIDTVIELLDIKDCFQTTVSSEEVNKGKPDPAVYLKAADKLGIKPTNCAGIEDSSNGLRAVKAADMTVIAYPNRHYPPTDDAMLLADITINQLNELSIELLNRQV